MRNYLNSFGYRIILVLSAIGAVLVLPACQNNNDESVLRLGTTTSIEDSGLLEYLLPIFEEQNAIRIELIAFGTGQVLELGKSGDVDVVLVHAPTLEDEFVSSEYGLKRIPVAYNDFIILGPLNDPAGVNGLGSINVVLEKIAANQAPFVSRGDNSGTYIRELELWDQTDYSPNDGDGWYFSIGQGMGSALNFANEQNAYVLSDRGTYLSQAANLPNLEIVFGGSSLAKNPDSSLLNYYSAIMVNPEIHPQVNEFYAKLFIKWITSIKTQEAILEFGMESKGQSFYYPDSEQWRLSGRGSSIQDAVEIEIEEKQAGLFESMLLIFRGNEQFLEIIFRTIQVSGLALLIGCALGIPFGAFLGLSNFLGKRFIHLVIFTGMGMPPVVMGLIAYLLLSNGGSLGKLEWLFTPAGMIFAQSILAFPLASGLTSSAVSAVPKDLILQVRSLGATVWQERWTILHQARRGVIAAILAALGRIVSEVGAVMLVGGNISGSTRVLSTAIVLETRQGEFALALALGLVLLGIALLSNALFFRFGGRWSQ